MHQGMCGGEPNPGEWAQVAVEANSTGLEVHAGMDFGCVVEDNIDLSAGDPVANV